MEERIREAASELSKIAAEARARFGELSVAQLNWMPAAKSWSVAQCLDHLIVTHSLYFPLFERLAAGSVATAWPTLSRFSWCMANGTSGKRGRFGLEAH